MPTYQAVCSRKGITFSKNSHALGDTFPNSYKGTMRITSPLFEVPCKMVRILPDCPLVKCASLHAPAPANTAFNWHFSSTRLKYERTTKGQQL